MSVENNFKSNEGQFENNNYSESISKCYIGIGNNSDL